MNTSARAQLISRETIQKLMSDDEIAKVSMAETASSLGAGDEYIDLEHLDRGMMRFSSDLKMTTKTIVPRNAVSSDTWTKITKALAQP